MTNSQGRKRPFGVMAIILLQLIVILGAILEMLLAYSGYTLIEFAQMRSHIANIFKMGQIYFDSNTIITGDIIVILITVIITLGLWQLKRWAWFLLMIQIGLSMGTDLYAYFSDDPQYLSMFINVFMVFYLNQREVQQAFEQDAPKVAA